MLFRHVLVPLADTWYRSRLVLIIWSLITETEERYRRRPHLLWYPPNENRGLVVFAPRGFANPQYRGGGGSQRVHTTMGWKLQPQARKIRRSAQTNIKSKPSQYQIHREWTLEQPSRCDTTWKLITTALRAFLVFTTWGDRPELRFWFPKNITHVIFSKYIFSKIRFQKCAEHIS